MFADAIVRIEGIEPQPGDEVRVVDDRGTCVGRGFYSPQSAIAVRILTRADTPITDAFLSTRIDEALRLRTAVLGLGAPAAPPPPDAAGPPLTAAERARLAEIEAQLAKIQSFAARFGLDALEETAELRKQRDALLQGQTAPVGAAGVATAAETAAMPATTAYRLVNSEGDGLGGLIVDVYGDYVAVQTGTAGMERRQDAILNALEERLHPKGIVDRGDARARQLEKLGPPRSGPLRGQPPEAPFPVYEYGLEMLCDLRPGHGQKTGLFLDQRENRRRFAGFAAGRNVLDVFSYSGGFALHAARAGAKSIALVDSSAEALELARLNLERNGIADADLVQAEWTEGFKHLREAGRLFELIVLDPPKFARAREGSLKALTRYGERVGLAFQIADDILNVEGEAALLG
ncbi:MAG: class I SAM-dependent methyltransferase, partial [Planctomycetota bacterium]|nr:class I SAM-dependent methyltransferase [Planctomycetota bacterium]